MYQVANILSYISVFSVLVPIICYIFFKNKNRVTVVLFVLLLVSFAADLGNELFMRLGGRGYSIINAFFIAQFFLLSYIYSLFFKNRMLIYIASILFTGFAIINTLFIQPFNEFQSWSDGVQSAILIIYSITCYNQLLKNPPEDERLGSLILWINMGVSFYFFMNLYLFINANYVFKSESTGTAMIIWGFHNFCNVVKNVFFAVGIYYAGRKAVYY